MALTIETQVTHRVHFTVSEALLQRQIVDLLFNNICDEFMAQGKAHLLNDPSCTDTIREYLRAHATSMIRPVLGSECAAEFSFAFVTPQTK